MTWHITFTTSFLLSLEILPQYVKNKFSEIFATLERDPTPANRFSIKLAERNLWRIPISRQYRLFYQYGNNLVKLIKISKRNEGTYKGYRLDKLEEEEIPDTQIPPWFVDDFETIPSYQHQRIEQIDLKKYQIPEIYWENLIKIGTEKDEEKYIERLCDYLEKSVTLEHRDKILNCCTDTPLPSLEAQIPIAPTEAISPDDFIEKLAKGELTVADFILVLSDKQKRILNLSSEKPVLVKGGAGTGKTIVAVHKVAKIAQENRKSGKTNKILFATYTTALANYVEQLLVDLLHTNKLEEYCIEVRSLSDLAKEYYKSQHSSDRNDRKIPDRGISKTILYDAYKVINTDESIKKSIRDNGGINFLLDEFIYYIEARGITQESSYIQLRSNTLRRRLSRSIWKIYQEWKKRIEFHGYITENSLIYEASQIIKKTNLSPPYTFLAIDEAQDLSPIALEFLVGLVSNSKQAFITADIEQSLYQRNCNWDDIQASFGYELQEQTLTQVFRNTQTIGIGCHLILKNSDKEYSLKEVTSQVKGNKPIVFLSDNDQLKIEKIKDFYKSNEKLGFSKTSGVILTPNSTYSQFIADSLSTNNLNAEYIHPEKISKENNFIQVLDIKSIKGLEFPFVTIVGLNEGLFPYYPNRIDSDIEEIIQQQRKQFYVACSRAIYSLLIVGNKSNYSCFLEPLRDQECAEFWKFEEF